MFKVKDTILADDIATARFHCDTARCKGACCVVGDAGAPVSAEEVPRLEQAFRLVADDLTPEARERVANEGLTKKNNRHGFELQCTEDGSCVFAVRDEQDIVNCAIQVAYYKGRTDWEKPISCHLYPIRLKRVTDFDYANYDPHPEQCAPACTKGSNEGIYLSQFLKEPLTRRYGRKWYELFESVCEEIRTTR